MNSSSNPQTKNKSFNSLPWDKVEKAIHQESKWLRNNLVASPFQTVDHNLNTRLDEKYIHRRIAILIVSGKVRARDIRSETSLWKNKEAKIGKEHGKKWHSSMMKIIGGHFQELGYKISTEPALNIGRADLGIYKENHSNVYVEVGTVSLYKLLLNLESMESSIFLIVPNTNHIIELSVLKAGYKEISS